MKTFIGFAMVVAGILLGAYVGVWVCFIGGICDVIEQVRSEHIEALGVAIGVAKVVFSGLVGQVSAIVLVVPGLAIASE